MILQALDDVGGRSYLKKQAKENPTAFLALLGRVVPLQVDAEIINSYVIRAPERAQSPEEWHKQHAPQKLIAP